MSIKTIFKLISILLVGFLISACSEKKEIKDSKIYKTKIGIYKGEASSLVLLAKEKGFFKEQNLDIELKLYRSGRDAIKGMLDDEVDYANGTEYVAIKNSFKRQDFKILASMAESDINGMLAKKSSGILNPSDVKGKRIGTTIGTATEYYTGVFLEQYALKLSDVNLINVPRKKRYEVMAKDSVDGLFPWEPFTYNLIQEYKNDITYFPFPVGFKFYFVFAVNDSFHKQNRVVSSKILKALKKAEELVDKNPKEFKLFVKEYFNYDDDYVNYSLPKYEFKLSFPYTLSTVMRNQAQWLVSNNLVENKGIVKLNTIYDVKILKELDPSVVTIME